MAVDQFKTKFNESSCQSRKRGLHHQIQDRVKGVLLGLAAGDRIGGPTQMATLLGESLVEDSTYVSKNLEKKYIDWWSERGFDTGNVSEKVFSLVSRGMPIYTAVNKVDQEMKGMTAGCNPVHRSAPIAMSVHLHDDEIAGIAERESLLTHKHHLAGLVSATNVQLVRSLIRGAGWSEAIKQMDNTCSPVICDAFKDARNGKIFSDGYSPHVLGAAIYFLNTSKTFDEMLEKAIDFSGDDNYCAVLSGSLGGARWGASSISENWFVGFTDIDKVNLVASSLANGW